VHFKFAAIKTLPPVCMQKCYSPQGLVYIHALELDPPGFNREETREPRGRHDRGENRQNSLISTSPGKEGS